MKTEILLILGILAVVLISGCTLFGPSKPSTVTVGGTVTTVGTATYPQKITFTSYTNHKQYVNAVNNKVYSISLPNPDSYQVTITWASLGVTGGDCNAGTLNLDTFDPDINRDWTC